MLDWLRGQEAGFSAVAAILVTGGGEKPDICTLRLHEMSIPNRNVGFSAK
jgi:hypothetical protein